MDSGFIVGPVICELVAGPQATHLGAHLPGTGAAQALWLGLEPGPGEDELRERVLSLLHVFLCGFF